MKKRARQFRIAWPSGDEALVGAVMDFHHQDFKFLHHKYSRALITSAEVVENDEGALIT